MLKAKSIFVYLLYVLSVFSLIAIVILIEERVSASLHDEQNRSQVHAVRLITAKKLVNYLNRLNDNSQVPMSNEEHINILMILNSKVLSISNDKSKKLEDLIKEIKDHSKPDLVKIKQVQAEILFHLIVQQEAEYSPSQRNMAPIYILFDEKWSGITLALWLNAMLTAFLSGVLTYKILIKIRHRKGIK